MFAESLLKSHLNPKSMPSKIHECGAQWLYQCIGGWDRAEKLSAGWFDTIGVLPFPHTL